MSSSNVLIYLLRRDLRVSDNPILHSLATQKDHGFTHVLPLYVFSAQQLEVSGFIPEDAKTKSPYPEARSRIANFWRCGPHRAKFLGESVWDLKEGLEKVGSGLCVRVGMVDEVMKLMLDGMGKNNSVKVGAVWMTSDEGIEEHREERLIKKLCNDSDIAFKTWVDEKYLKDE
jgi:deoxyribodipyrimidine photo-lyase